MEPQRVQTINVFALENSQWKLKKVLTKNNFGNIFSLLFSLFPIMHVRQRFHILTNSDCRKDGEINNLSSRLEEEESLVAQLKKKIKNLEARIAELEEELEAERQARVKVEKQRSDLSRDIDDLTAQLDDTGNVAQSAVS